MNGVKRREKTRQKATETGGEMIFELKKYDIFQFKDDASIAKFAEYIRKHEEVELIESGVNYRVAVKYREK